MATLLVGDVHGCRRELDDLLALAGFQPGSDRLLLTGDAFARGPEPRAVWERIVELSAGMVLGNHDDRLRSHLAALAQGEPVAPRKREQQQTLAALVPVAADLLPWLAQLPLCLVEPQFVLVHAGINPLNGLAGTTREEFLTLRTWPPNGGIRGDRWHDVCPPQDRLVAFGHDAPGGLVVRWRSDGTPWLIGLDTGCVYGGQLSGYLLEQQRVVQTPCRRPRGYCR